MFLSCEVNVITVPSRKLCVSVTKQIKEKRYIRGDKIYGVRSKVLTSAVKFWLVCPSVCHLSITCEVIISGVFNRSVYPLPAVCVLQGSVTQVTVSVWSFYTPSTQLHKLSVQLLNLHSAAFSVHFHYEYRNMMHKSKSTNTQKMPIAAFKVTTLSNEILPPYTVFSAL